MDTCSECGCEVQQGARFCPSCGCELLNHEEEVSQTRFCKNCGYEFDMTVKFCPKCGASTSTGEQKKVNKTTMGYSNKNPVLAAVLSLAVTGLGQIYLGLKKKGIILFALSIVSMFFMAVFVGWIFWAIIWIYSIYDAYNSTLKLNNDIMVEDRIDFDNLL